jgi:hypothetical protein
MLLKEQGLLVHVWAFPLLAISTTTKGGRRHASFYAQPTPVAPFFMPFLRGAAYSSIGFSVAAASGF